MEYCKLQIICLMIAIYIAFVYFREMKLLKVKVKRRIFELLIHLSIFTLFFDMVTAYTVNHLESVPAWLNLLTHFFFLWGIDTVVCGTFFYILIITDEFPEAGWKRVLYNVPYLVSVVTMIVTFGELEYVQGEVSAYSMGIPVYACFGIVGVYIVLALFKFFSRWNYIERHKRSNIALYLMVLTGITGYQFVNPDALITSAGVLVLILGMYVNQENPAMKELERYHNEMVLGFATLVEERDDSTGAHIRRTSAYAESLAKALREKGLYKDILTKDYIRNLSMAAPMHDIGKISIPDAILLKPGKLTEEEFETMKEHTVSGGKIIKEAFGKLDDADYMNMAYEVAVCHHEKWNGKGYPCGLKGEEIPLSARIMAIADVFDAVSEKRCYRDAMPLERCFEIIEEGKGTDFDPQLAEIFLEMREQVIRIHKSVGEPEVQKKILAKN